MCVAFPGKILKIEGTWAQVDFAGTLAQVNVSMVAAHVGEYVLVHAGVALQVLAADEAEPLAALFCEVEAAANE